MLLPCRFILCPDYPWCLPDPRIFFAGTTQNKILLFDSRTPDGTDRERDRSSSIKSGLDKPSARGSEDVSLASSVHSHQSSSVSQPSSPRQMLMSGVASRLTMKSSEREGVGSNDRERATSGEKDTESDDGSHLLSSSHFSSLPIVHQPSGTSARRIAPCSLQNDSMVNSL